MRKKRPLLLVGAIATLVAAAAVSLVLRVVILPDGTWVVARTREKRAPNGLAYRPYLVGADGFARIELDTNGDGRYDLRGDDWHGATPVWCWKRVEARWEAVAPSVCESGWRSMQTRPE